jgi:hypothetical protein
MRLFLPALCAVAAAFGCGGRSSQRSAVPSDAGSDEPADGGDTSHDAEADIDAGNLPECTGVTVGPNYPCDTPGAACGCRDDVRPECESALICREDAWSELDGACSPAPPTACPTSVAEARDQPCSPTGAVCNFSGNVSCYCDLHDASGSSRCLAVMPRWYCGVDDGEGPCPDGIPEVGSACNIQSLPGQPPMTCGHPCFDPYPRTCADGAWVEAQFSGECV